MKEKIVTPRLQALPVPATGSLDAYIRSVNAIPVLDASAEQALALRLHEHNDLQAAQQLVLANLRHVVHIARGYNGYGLQLADLIQEGNIGLMKAVKRFDPAVGVRLISFAVHWIRAEIHEFVLRNWRIVKVATTKAQRKLFFNLRGAKQHLGWLHDNEVQAIARDLKVKPEEVLEMEQRLSSHDASFDPVPVDGDEDAAAFTPEQYLHDGEQSNPEYQVVEGQWEADQHSRLRKGLAKLDERSRDILKQRWLTEGTKTGLKELAEHYGVSAERIRQIENNAIRKLRGSLLPA